MDSITVPSSEIKKLANDINEIKVELEPMKQAIPMLVTLNAQVLDVLKEQSAQTEIIKGTLERVEKNESRIERQDAKIDSQNEKIADLNTSTKVNSVKIAAAATTLAVIVSLALKSFLDN